jgi:hypothetical protein
MLQQVLLEQKQRIRELEQKLQVQEGAQVSISQMKFQNELKVKT